MGDKFQYYHKNLLSQHISSLNIQGISLNSVHTLLEWKTTSLVKGPLVCHMFYFVLKGRIHIEIEHNF